ncbi:hypothetical protein J8273_0591 [Carpediemonas membranifera]|uniref:Uncharacterized protein n=1 Tax=Carpediemonas membranifera TaxID=201153 RepID=A0A8J6E0N6_9EUKA|nr:hypothetical protein J8273_0591 [Carpediemonas membranifera]|eukprot:KAG9395349.1 hypothetical protein J8273_0591 [Carpediemonas membranifera]
MMNSTKVSTIQLQMEAIAAITRQRGSRRTNCGIKRIVDLVQKVYAEEKFILPADFTNAFNSVSREPIRDMDPFFFSPTMRVILDIDIITEETAVDMSDIERQAYLDDLCCMVIERLKTARLGLSLNSRKTNALCADPAAVTTDHGPVEITDRAVVGVPIGPDEFVKSWQEVQVCALEDEPHHLKACQPFI